MLTLSNLLLKVNDKYAGVNINNDVSLLELLIKISEIKIVLLENL